MDKALANLNRQLAKERGRVTNAVEEMENAVSQVQELEQKMRELVERSAIERRAIIEKVAIDTLNSYEESKVSVIFGVQLLYGPMDLSSMEWEEDRKAPKGLNVYTGADEEQLARLLEELGVEALVTVVPCVPATPATSASPVEGLVESGEEGQLADDVPVAREEVQSREKVQSTEGSSPLMPPIEKENEIAGGRGGREGMDDGGRCFCFFLFCSERVHVAIRAIDV